MAKRKVEERGIPASWRRGTSPGLTDTSSPEDDSRSNGTGARKPRSHTAAMGPTNRMPDWTSEELKLGRPLTAEEKSQRELAARAALLVAPALPALRVTYNDPSARRKSLEGDGEETFWQGPHA